MELITNSVCESYLTAFLAQICLASHCRRWAEHLNNLGKVAAWEAVRWAESSPASMQRVRWSRARRAGCLAGGSRGTRFERQGPFNKYSGRVKDSLDTVWSPKFQLKIVRISGYIPLRQSCFETFRLLVNERERLLSHPFCRRVCENEGNVGREVGGTYECIGLARVGVHPVSVCFLCARHPGTQDSGERGTSEIRGDPCRYLCSNN